MQLTRRRLLGGAAAAAAGGAALLWRGLVLREGEKGAAGRLRVGVIGVSGRGKADLKITAAVPGVEIAALCDVDEGRAAEARSLHPGAKFHADFRKLLDEQGIDAVVIATPDHTHAVAALAALRSGRHVYCEKPLARSVGEVRALAEAARRERRVTQVGTQIHNTGTNYRQVVKLLQDGTIGPVTEVHVFCGKNKGLPPGWSRPPGETPIPAGFDYELWLGPAPFRPYHPCYCKDGNWRRYWDFGGGTIADMGSHYLDLPFWALGLRHPHRVSAEGPPVNAEAAPEWLVARWEFPSRGEHPPVAVTWYDGGKRPGILAGMNLEWGDGVLFVGAKGMLIADYLRWKLLPEDRFRDHPGLPPIPEPAEHHAEWIAACRAAGGTDLPATTCSFEAGSPLAETILLGTVAYRLGRPFEWDGPSMEASDPGAKALLQPAYRAPWGS